MTGIIEVLRRTDRMTKRDAALAFARAGVPVFPCVPDGKRPLTSAGFKDATIEEDRIRQWWRRWPHANLGMPTGPTSGIDVIDVDVRKNGSGIEGFRAAVESLGVHDIARVRTPSGGMHAYYLTNGQAQPCWQAGVAHIDFRGVGGYVLVPPSRLQVGKKPVGYRVISLSPLRATSVDAALLRKLIDPCTEPSAGPRRGAETHPAALAAWVSHLTEGERNHGLFWAACRLFDSGATAAETTIILLPAATAIGLSEREIATTIRSAWRQSGSHPAERGLPDLRSPRGSSTRKDLGPSI